MLRAEMRDLPPELGVSGTGFYFQGSNLSDDLFMFMKRRLGPSDGVVAGQAYWLDYTVVLASGASACAGIGGSPGLQRSRQGRRRACRATHPVGGGQKSSGLGVDDSGRGPTPCRDRKRRRRFRQRQPSRCAERQSARAHRLALGSVTSNGKF